MFCAGFVLVVVWLFVAIFAEPSPEPVRFTHFMVHHTDTPAKTERGKPYPQFDKSRCDEMARARGWDECGYNFLVERDGLIFKARPLWKKGAHCPNDGMNRHAISAAFVLRGTEEKPSRKALDAMLGIYEWMNSSLGYKLILTFHGDHAKTICPSNNVREAMRDEVR
jgi:hypothetical protein